MRLALSGVHIADAVISDVVSVPPGVFSRAKWSNTDGSLMLVVRREVAEHTQVIVLPPKHLITPSNPPSTLPSTAPSTSSRMENDQSQAPRADTPAGVVGASPEPGHAELNSSSSKNQKLDVSNSSNTMNTSVTAPHESQQQGENDQNASGENDGSYMPEVISPGARPSTTSSPPTREEVRRSLRALQAAEDLRFQEVCIWF